MKSYVTALAFTLVSLLSAPAHAEQITIAVATNFIGPMEALVSRFQQDTGHRVKVSYGSSGKIFAQIQHNAPFQAFFSADQDKPIALEKAGLAVPGSRFTYAIGGLVLWSSKPNLVDAELQVLQQGRFNKLALANPRLAPYGAAAVETLQRMGLLQSTRGQWVQGENIGQTYQFVATGNADLGFVAKSQVMKNGSIERGSHWIVPDEFYAPIRQDAVLLKRGENSPAARALLAFVTGGVARKVIAQFGYQVEVQ